jgi:hypothetical protein
MSEQKPEGGDQQDTSDSEGIDDDALPEDVRPTEDNPLARHPDQTGEDDDEIGADREGASETAPTTQEEADYGGAGSGDSGS